MSTPYGPSDDELAKYERRRSCGRLLIEKRAIVETMRIGLTSADMHIPEMH
jgi:hypothetical protein